MLNFLSSIVFLLEQNVTEKRFTILGIGIFVVFIFMLILSTLSKEGFMPKNTAVRNFMIFILIASIVALILLLIFYK